jgi:chemotaxis protein MotB
MQLDPWAQLGDEEPVKDGWLLSFVDILTLFLVLLLVLLMLQGKGQDTELAAKVAASGASEAAAPLKKAARIEAAQVEVAQETTPPTTPLVSLKLPHAQVTEAHSLIPSTGPRFMLTDVAAPEAPEMAAHSVDALPKTKSKQEFQADAVRAEQVEPASAASDTRTAMAAIKPLTALSAAGLVQELKWKGLEAQLSISQSQSQLRLETKDSVLFTSGDAGLTPSGQKLLQGLAALLKRHAGPILVEGHADNRPVTSGKYPSNWELSSARASSVVRYLIEQGLDAARLRALGYGDTRPKAGNDTIDGRAANRRVSLVLELNAQQGSEAEAQAQVLVQPQSRLQRQAPLM